MNINYNIIDDNSIQIYGEVNGFAWRVEFEGRKVWRYSISFFQGNKASILIHLDFLSIY